MIVVSRLAHPRRCRRFAIALFAAAVIGATLAGPALAAPYFTFNGGGWGHGIGLSQYGARGYANQGKTYDWILAHYYQGTSLVTKPAVTVRVNLDKSAYSRASWWIQSGKSDTALTIIQMSDSTKRVALSATGRYWITTSAGNTRVHNDETYTVKNADGTSSTKHRPGTIIRTFSGSSYATSGGLVRMLSASGPFGQSSIRWRGNIVFVPVGDAASKAVNYVGIESYLYGVVPRESPSSWPAEALKAQAVAARSYAYQDARDARIIYCTTMSQVYNGYDRPGEAHEAASTNAAVNATKGQLVWYGTETKPVKTFFSSSTGGHTASIQDVWTESTPKPYYTGVPDADQDNPNYTWKVGPLATSTVTSKVRDKDSSGEAGLQYSAPWPYYIEAIATERASSGYAHHVTLRWSNGQSFRIKGDTLRSALGLKSTKFWVATTGEAPTTANTFEQTDTRLAWVGPWYTAKHAEASGGSYTYTGYYSSLAIAKFNGTGVRWIGNRSSAYGIAEVWLDGIKVATVDQYASTGQRRQVLFSTGGLAAGDHQLIIKAIRKKNVKSSGYSSSVDRIDVYEGSLVQADTPVSAYEQSNAKIALLGLWMESSSAAVSGGTHAWTSRAGDQAIVEFFGSGFSWIGSRASTYGSARVRVDGGAPQVVSLTATGPENQQVLFSIQSLPTGVKHRVVIEAVGPTTGNEGHITADRFDITGGWLLPATLPLTRLQENSDALASTGTWGRSAVSGASGGYHATSAVKGATMSLRFDGTGVKWIATKTRAYGTADVVLDGVRVAAVDLYSSSKLTQKAVFSRSGLAAGDHTLTIRVLGTKNSASSGTAVSVDALDITGITLPPTP